MLEKLCRINSWQNMVWNEKSGVDNKILKLILMIAIVV
jgi:hypothetical protein